MPPFSAGTFQFPTKGDAQAFVREILNSAPLDEILKGDRAVFIRELFALHPRAAEKAEGGIIGFMVRENDFNGARTRGFHVVHDDGSTTPFSYAPCLNPNKPELSCIAAMRAAIMLSQRRVMLGYFGLKDRASCHACGKLVERQHAHVHHVPPKRFRDIAASFIAARGEPKTIKGVLGVSFASLQLQSEWVTYHDARASRVVVCAPCNFAAEREP